MCLLVLVRADDSFKLFDADWRYQYWQRKVKQMDQLSPIGRSAAPAQTGSRTSGASSPRPAASSHQAPDRADISEAARLLSHLRELPDVRQDLVDRVRGEIEAGRYETEHKLNEAVDEILYDFEQLG